MFFGTTPAIISQFLEKELLAHNPKKVWVLFSGNFVVEQIAGKTLPNAEVHATDISLYSRAIGYAANNTESEISLKEEYHEMFPHCAKETTPLGIAATVIFFSDVAKHLKKQHIAYYKNLLRDATVNEEAYLKKIKEKLTKFIANTPNMKFYGVDACDLIPKIEKDDLVFYDPPVDLGNYESEFKALESCFNFHQPSYQEINDEIKDTHLSDFTEKGIVGYYRNNNPLSQERFERLNGYKEIFRYQYKYNGYYCVYSNKHIGTFVGQWEPLKEIQKAYRLINDKDVITEDSKVSLVPVKSAVGNHYRLLWVKKAEMLDSGACYLVVIDEIVIGLLQLGDGLKFGSELVVINSDPACPYSKYKRLSKLILYICSTQQTIDLINEKSMWEHVGFTTRVFTNEPVSMKYRSLFKLTERSEDEGNYKYKLIYQNRNKIFPTYQDGLKAWLKKEGKVLHNGH